jgi:hypothetical protein
MNVLTIRLMIAPVAPTPPVPHCRKTADDNHIGGVKQQLQNIIAIIGREKVNILPNSGPSPISMS